MVGSWVYPVLENGFRLWMCESRGDDAVVVTGAGCCLLDHPSWARNASAAMTTLMVGARSTKGVSTPRATRDMGRVAGGMGAICWRFGECSRGEVSQAAVEKRG